MWVSPFRHLRLIGYLLLPAAFRSLSRLSSALSAKASTLRSFLLDLLVLAVFCFHSVENTALRFRAFFWFFNFVMVFFSDVLIKIFSYSKSLLYEVFKVQPHLLSSANAFSFFVTVLSVIRKLSFPELSNHW